MSPGAGEQMRETSASDCYYILWKLLYFDKTNAIKCPFEFIFISWVSGILSSWCAIMNARINGWTDGVCVCADNRNGKIGHWMFELNWWRHNKTIFDIFNSRNACISHPLHNGMEKNTHTYLVCVCFKIWVEFKHCLFYLSSTDICIKNTISDWHRQCDGIQVTGMEIGREREHSWR